MDLSIASRLKLLPLNELLQLYTYVAEILELDPQRDRFATSILASYLDEVNVFAVLNEVLERLEGKEIAIVCPGSNLDKEIVEELASVGIEIVAVDGAMCVLRDPTPKILVTDLDGVSRCFDRVEEIKPISFIHAHGDNIDLLQNYVPRALLSNVPIVGTTQVEPRIPVLNFGGFTDGDRALFISLSFRPKLVVLVGCDYGPYLGEASKGVSMRCLWRKVLKHGIARYMMDYAARRFGIEVFNVGKPVSRFVKSVTLDQLLRML